MNTAILSGTTGIASHVSNAPLTTDITRQISTSLLLNEIDERIVKIRPMATPIDQLSRWAGARNCGSMIVDYYSVDTPATEASLSIAIVEDDSTQELVISTSNDKMFRPTETILVPEVECYDIKGNSTGPLVLYVIDNDSDGLTVMALNSPEGTFPAIPKGAKLVRMGRAAAELDMQTAQSEALPQKSQNYCQIFKAQVEQSTLMKLSNKEVGWTFSDQEEVAIIDMRLGMEKNYLFGAKQRFQSKNDNGEVFITGGIWNQTPREINYTKGALSDNDLVGISRAAFTQSAGSARKILLGGSGFIEQLSLLSHTKFIGATETITKWGLDFSELHTKFGTLYVLHSEIFDQCGHENDGFILDPEYVQKYVHIPFNTEVIDLKKSGARNSQAVVITEASCLVLRYPQSHLRVVAK